MHARRVAVVAALVGGISWIVKLAIMAAQDGPDPDSVPESIAFVLGLLGMIVATAATAVAWSRERSPMRRVLTAIAAVAVAAVVQLAGQSALTALPGDGWVQEEAIFGIFGVALVTLAVIALRRDRARPA